MNPKVLVGCPTSDHKDYCLKEFIKGIKELTYPNFDILLVDNSKNDNYYNKINSLGIPVIKSTYTEKARDRIVIARNILRQKVIDEGYDYFFSLEQDVIPPKDIIEQLINKNKEIITGIYYKYFKTENGTEILPLIYKYVSKDRIKNYTVEEVDNKDIIKIGAAGLGCVLIKRNVLEKISFKYNPENEAFDDMWFYLNAIEQGFDIFADCSQKCKHLIYGMNWNLIEK